MPSLLDEISPILDPEINSLAVRLVVAWACGWLISRIARGNRPRDVADTLSLTLILMSILIAMATQIIGDNIARAFSLVGALSIVRFRTAVPETRDVAFVLAAVVVGMAVGAGQYWVSGIGLVTIYLATRFMTTNESSAVSTSASPSAWRLTIKVGLHTVAGWEAELDRMTQSYQLISAETARFGGSLELVYRYQPRDGFDARALVAALNAVPTIESVATKPMS